MTGYADVVRDGKKSREVVSTYHETLKDAKNQVETVSLTHQFEEANETLDAYFRLR